MTEPTELLPCPFCGAAAHFEMGEGRWEWVECESCGMQGNRSASLMEDCKPKLAEEWNRRTPQPTQAQAGAVDDTALIRRLADALDECAEDSATVVNDYVQAYGENHRPLRLKALRDTVKEAKEALAAARSRLEKAP